MKKEDVLEKGYKSEDKLLISKMFDKMEFCKKRNRITHTDFLDLYEQKILQKILNSYDGKYLFYGGIENAERKILVFYPKEMEEDRLKKELESILVGIRIILPPMLQGEYSHRNYLSGIIKIGIKREKTGDILFDETGADIIAIKDSSEYIASGLGDLKRFQSSNIKIIQIDELRKPNINLKEIKLVVPSLRLDAIVSELAKTSRSKANEIIDSGRVWINDENEYKHTKQVKEKDKIVIRGKGKYIFDSIEGNTRKDNYIIKILKYI